MKKRFLAMALVFAMALSLLPMTALATEETTVSYAGKTISIMGDSISTFTGYCPDGYRMRYPDSNSACDVDTVDQTWWMQLINELGANLGISESWAGSTVSNTLDANSGDRGPDAAMASWTRINNLDANGTPDVILFYSGTNDRTYVGSGTYTLGTFDASTAPTKASGEDVTKWDTVVDAYSDAILRMRSAYPGVEIISILPIDVGSATYEAFNEQIKAVCDHYEVPTVALDSVSSSNLYDGLHPNAFGMDIITAEVKAVMTDTEVVLPEKPVVDVDTYLRQLPDPAYNTTNLWSNPDGAYYNGSGWATNYPSITIPVKEGDRIYASSFQAAGSNGSTGNSGIRVTYFAADDTVVSSLPAGTVYREYTLYGWLTVPANAVAVNIPMWVNDKNAVVNLLTLLDDPNVETPEPQHDFLQAIPEGAYNDTNLWYELTPYTWYYGSGYVQTNGTKSVIIPVEPGDKVYGSSLARGIRVSYFYGNTQMGQLSPTECASAHSSNGGYLIVPDGVNAMNIPMWNDDSNPTLYLLNLPERPVPNSHLQWVEEGTELYSDTNLWELLTPEATYYGASGWTTYTNAGNTVHSVTIPVEPGDQIYANSFQASGTNGGTQDGIRVTFFNGNDVVKQLAQGTVYSTYTSDGYLTVPENANAVCIPVWVNDDTAVLNLLTLPKRIEAAELTITAPVTGATPQPDVSGTGYTGTISWSGNPTVFAADTAYTATVALTAADGYKFATDFTATVNSQTATVNDDGTVTFTFPATEVVEEPKNDHLQAIPEDAYNDTNLWTALTPNAYYYDANGNWTTLSSGESKVYSIVIPVTGGDRIYASSFQSSDKNGSFTPYVQNGIRVTYLNGDEVFKKLTGAQVYTEFKENNHEYITVPEGANAVCVPMWVNDGNSVVYLLDLPDRPKGEISGDGEVSLSDFTILARYLAGWSGYEEQIVSMKAADVNGDEKVSSADAMILARKLAGWAGYDKYFE